MTVTTSAARHLLVRFGQPARLPEAILAALRDEVVLAGWMRASGIISDVQIRVFDPRTGGTSNPRRISGAVQIIAMEGSIGLAGGDVSCGMRVVLARETESGLETIAGDLVEARIETLEVLVTAFDDVTATRQLDAAGVWVMDASESAGQATGGNAAAANLPTAATSPAPPQSPPVVQPVMPSPMQSGFSEVVRAAASAAPVEAPRPAPAPAPVAAPAARPSPTFSASAAMPARIARPVAEETEDDPIPEAGDTVEHFAFGRCEVVKSDGDRLHVRLGKEQRVKEIALEMLKVSSLPAEEGQLGRHWKLARKL